MQVLADASLAATASGIAAVEAMHAALVRYAVYEVCLYSACKVLGDCVLLWSDCTQVGSSLCRRRMIQQV